MEGGAAREMFSGVCVLVGLSVKVKVEVSKCTEYLYIRYSIPTARL